MGDYIPYDVALPRPPQSMRHMQQDSSFERAATPAWNQLLHQRQAAQPPFIIDITLKVV